MQTTSNYGFNIVEGTDIVNPLTQLNPNFTALDTDLKAVSDLTIDAASCIKSGTVHAVTRTLTDNNVFKFTATGNWETGDTMTVDGVSVSVYLPDGTAPLTGAFIINTEVLCIKNGSRITLFASPNKPVYTASDIDMASGDSVQDAIDQIGSVIRVVEGGAYASGDTWAIPSAAQDLIDSGKYFLVEASFFYGDTVSSARLTKVTTRGFGRHVALTLNRTDIQTGLVNISASTFTAYGFDISHAPKLYDLYLFPLSAY